MRVSIAEATKRGWVKPSPDGYELNSPCRDSVSSATSLALKVTSRAPLEAAQEPAIVTNVNNFPPAVSAVCGKTALPKAVSVTRRKKDAEGKEQSQLVKQFRAEFPEIGSLLIHIPNGGSRKNAFEGWRLKEQGVRAGVSDLFLPVACDGFHGLWVEFKASAPNTAAVSASQIEWVRLMKQQGYAAQVCVGVEDAMQAFRAYLETKEQSLSWESEK